MNKKITTSILAISLALGVSAPMVAQNSSETKPEPTPIGETTRSSRTEKLRGEGEWTFVNYKDEDILTAFRMDMDSGFNAEYVVEMFGDPDQVEANLDMEYEGSFRVRGMGTCTGTELYNPDNDLTLYAVACADDEYINFATGTNKADVLDAMEQMQDGYTPEIENYEEEVD